MKKLIIVAAVALTAALTQAASVSWSVSGLKDSEGNSLTSGAGYVFTTKGSNATTIDAVTTALAGLTSASALQTWLQSNALAALKGDVSSTSLISVSGVDLATSGVPEKTSSTSLFAVIVDDDSFGEGVKYAVTGESNKVKTPAASTTNVATFNLTAPATTAWTAVAPEPTSGLLMLVGLGALALRRRRA